KKVHIGPRQALRAFPSPYQFPIRKTDLVARRSRHASALSGACRLTLLTLQRLDVTRPGFKQQLLQYTTLVQAALDFRHQVLGDVNRKAPPLRPTIQHPTRVLFTRLAGSTVRTDARGAA